MIQLQPQQQNVQWRIFKNQFGRRWEGTTRWYRPSTNKTKLWVEAVSDPLSSIYQLEFPTAEPSLGTWRGWGVIEPGDTRVVSLSEATVTNRTPGSSTFQFEGVGGRCNLRNDGSYGFAAEINFFHKDRRCGLVAYCTPQKNTDNDDDECGRIAKEWSVMLMSFRAATISHDRNVTFVQHNSATLQPAYSLHWNNTYESDASAEHARRRLYRYERTRCEEMRPTDYMIRPWDTSGRRTWKSSCSFSFADIVGIGKEMGKKEHGNANEEPILTMCLPDGLWCSVPLKLNLRQADGNDDEVVIDPPQICTQFRFSCDFTAIGGPIRSITLEYKDGSINRWICEDFARSYT